MTVNMSKTKITVFTKGGFLAANEVWRYGDEEIEVVNSYKYLGLYFTTKLSLRQAVGDLAAKAKIRTSQILKCLWRLGNVPRNFILFFNVLCPDPTDTYVWIRAVGFPTVCSNKKSAHVCVQMIFECQRANTKKKKKIYGD